MAYVKHNYQPGETLRAAQLNDMDNQIAANEAANAKTNDDLNELGEAIDYKNLSPLKDMAINTSSNVIPSSIRSYPNNWCALCVPAKEGDAFYVTGFGGNDDRLYAFSDADGNVLLMSGGAERADNKKIIAPQDTAYFAYNSRTFYSGVPVEYKVEKGISPSIRLYNLEEFEKKATEDIERANNVLNGYDKYDYTDGKNIDRNTGAIVDEDGVSLTDYIEISYGTNSVRYYYNEATGGSIYRYNIAFYNEQKVLTGTIQPSTPNAEYRTLSAPADAKFVRFSFKSGTKAKITNNANPPTIVYYETTSYKIDGIDKRMTDVEAKIERINGAEPYIIANAESLSSGQKMVACSDIDIKKDDVTTFWCNVDASDFGAVTVGHGYKIPYGAVVTVDATNVTTFYGTTQYTQKPHGLSIDKFLGVEIIHAKNARATIRVTTVSGQYVLDSNAVAWGGCKGEVCAVCESGTVTDCKLSVTFCDFMNDLYMCGDSYTSFGDAEKYPKYLMENGYTNIAICGFGGATSADQIKCFRQMVEVGKPKYFVWALGMNDPDTDTSVNSNWKAFVEEVISTCEEKGITPILATIPNVPNRINTYKNEYVRNSGYRYIDFAKAVGAEQTGSSWYSGLLSDDNLHPSELGAKALYARFITDVPEIMY